MKTTERLRLPADHPFVDALAPNAYDEFTRHGRTVASYDAADIDDFLKQHPDIAVGSERFTVTQAAAQYLYCLRSWEFSLQHNWAVKLLREKGHQVGNYHPSDGLINIDGQLIDLGSMHELLNSRYPREWSDYRKRHLEYREANRPGAIRSGRARRDLFSIDGHVFETPGGRVLARVINNPDAAPSGGGFSDQAWFILKFSDGRELTLVLSDAALHHDPDNTYRTKAFQIVGAWLAHGGSSKIEFFGE